MSTRGSELARVCCWLAILVIALTISSFNGAVAQEDKPPSDGYQVTIKNCDEPICAQPALSASQLKKMANDACIKIVKSRKLLEQLIPKGRSGLDNTLRGAGVARTVVTGLNGSKSDTWNAIRVLDILVKTQKRCDNGVYMECEADCSQDEAAWVRPKIGWTIHLCVKGWFCEKNIDRAATILHELTHFGGSDDDDREISAHQLANVSDAIIPELADAYDKIH